MRVLKEKSRLQILFPLLLVAAFLAAVYLLFRDGKQTFYIEAPNASQIVKGNDVKVGGQKVGTVQGIELTRDYLASIKIAVTDGSLLPLSKSTVAVVQSQSLSGSANRYVELSLGPNDSDKLKDGDTIALDKQRPAVELDAIFNAFDPKTRKSFARLIKGAGDTLDGREAEFNKSLSGLAPLVKQSNNFASKLVKSQPALTGFIDSSAQVVDSLARESESLTSMVSNVSTAMSAAGRDNQALAQAIQALPQLVKQGSTTLPKVNQLVEKLKPSFEQLKPATGQINSLAKNLRVATAMAPPVLVNASNSLERPGATNDLRDLLTSRPGDLEVFSPAIKAADSATTAITPMVRFARPYAPEMSVYFRGLGQATSGYDANGHYARLATVFSPTSLSPVPGFKPLVDSLQSYLGTQGTGIVVNGVERCPGSSVELRPDGSNAWRDSDGKLDCNPAIRIGSKP